ncbi:mPR-like GPCR protein [Coniochaeta ligniaria NRRL 30616]|uniref:MPR-like GPCR protein n=1 Tax=Coniochaeta ligniaria NRRL 30616 TaxID=1408157 RepID=A0A1J7IZG3_9PEZI|nr:mPR-like GPCR protein [Coniochaeta ligniaria NRRL 30616]
MVDGIRSDSPGSTTPPPPTEIELAARGRRRPKLLSFDELPEWYQDNHFIREGYRPVSGSARVSFHSWLYLHNESMNVYTHLVPAIGFFLGLWYVLQYLHGKYPNVTGSDDIIFVVFLLTATACLGLSATYHTLINHSVEVETIWLRLDFVGIVLLTLGDFVSGIYLVFWCDPTQQKVYWAMICSLGTMTIFILVSPKFQGRKWRTFRTLTFVSTGLSGFAPLAHGVYLFGWSQMMNQSGMPYYLAEGALLILGATVYATRFPEAWSPGRFDIYGGSHQLFHILVVMATIVQLVGILDAYDYNYNNRTCAAP